MWLGGLLLCVDVWHALLLCVCKCEFFLLDVNLSQCWHIFCQWKDWWYYTLCTIFSFLRWSVIWSEQNWYILYLIVHLCMSVSVGACCLCICLSLLKMSHLFMKKWTFMKCTISCFGIPILQQCCCFQCISPIFS